MSIIYNDTAEKSELQRRVMADLREKQTSKPLNEGTKKLTEFDDLGNPAYTDGLHHTGSLRWLAVAVVLALLIGLMVLMFTMQG